MKRLSLFAMVLVVLSTAAVQAQSIRPVAQPDAHMARIEQQIDKLTLLRADVQAIVLRRQISQNWEGEAWVNASRTTYDYNGELQTTALSEEWDGDSWENSTRILTAYSSGLPAETTHEVWTGASWAPESRTLYAYSGGELSEVRYQNRLNNAWVDEERTTITMSNGALASAQTDVWQGQAWVPSDRYSVTQEGDDVVTISEEWSGSAWVNVDRTVFVDLTISELFDVLQEWQSEFDVVFGFSFMLNFPDTIHQEWDGTQWVNVSRQTTERDDNGRPVILTTDSWEDGEWVSEMRFTATYDSAGRIGGINWETFDEEWMPFLIETYTYDDAGYLAKILSQLDFGFGLTNASQVLFEWTNTASSTEGSEVPARITLDPVYPNPFNPQATVRYHLDAPAQALIRVFDAAGRQVATLVDGVQPAGDHTVTFNAAGLPSGVYLVRLETPLHLETRAVTLLR